MLLNSLFKHWSYRIFAPGTLLREKYEALKQLLGFDIACHEQMAEFQDLLHGGQHEDFAGIRKRFTLFSEQVLKMIDSLDVMDPGNYASLKSYHKKFDFYTRFLLAPPKLEFGPPFVHPLHGISLESKDLGNKARHLATLHNKLDLPVPRGFGVTTSGYHYFIEYNDLRIAIDELLAGLAIDSPHSLNLASGHLTELILNAEVPPDVERAMLAVYDSWQQAVDDPIYVAVRSSAASEDGEYSFAGLYSTVLHVTRSNIGKAYKEVLASKYSAEALFYRISQGLGDEETGMSVLVQEMVEAHSSGVLYTRDIHHKPVEQDHLHLHAVPGLGEQLVSGAVSPDYFVVTRETPPALVSRKTGNALLSDDQVTEIAEMGISIERYFNAPQDIEWAMDRAGKLYILQARTLHLPTGEEEYEQAEHDNIALLDGCESASSGVAAGIVYQVDTTHELEDVPVGAILVTRNSPPSLVKVINRLSGVIAEHGSRASHFATVAREFGIPFLVGIKDACSLFQPGSLLTVDGYSGAVYQGQIDELIERETPRAQAGPYHRILTQALKFITPLELIDPAAENFTPEGCRSMHDIIRFCHEKALWSMFTTNKPGTGRGSLRLIADMPLDVFLFDVGDGISAKIDKDQGVPLETVASIPFHALWKGLSHPDVQWKQKPYDWEAYDKIELAGGVPPKRDSFAFASYAVIGADYLHFNIRFGYHFTIVDVLCGENIAENHCMLRFAGGGGDYDKRSLRIDFISRVLDRLHFEVEQKGDLLEAKLPGMESVAMQQKLDMLGRLLGATKLMDMVLDDQQMVDRCVDDFFNGRYSFSQEG
ncbi:MAG: PEP/pyruvate-binding domain-containing protein [Desulforhopalus sp.]